MAKMAKQYRVDKPFEQVGRKVKLSGGLARVGVPKGVVRHGRCWYVKIVKDSRTRKQGT